MSEQKQAEQSPASRRRLLWASGAVLSLFLLVLILLPYGLKLGLERWLTATGSTVAGVEDVDFNPFSGRLVLHDVHSAGAGGTLRCVRAALHLDWWPLWQRRARVRAVVIEEGELDLRRDAAGNWSVGGLLFPADEVKASEVEEKEPWAWGVEEIGLRDLTVRYRDPAGSGEVTIDRLSLKKLATWKPQGESPFALRLLSGGGSVEVQGTLSPFGASRSVRAEFGIERLPLDLAGPFLAGRGVKGLGGTLQGKGTVDAAFEGTGARLKVAGKLRGEGLRGNLPQLRVHGGALSWDGEVRLRPGDKESRLTAAGTVDAATVDLEAASLRIRGEGLEVTGTLAAGAVPLFRGDGAARALSIDDLGRKRRLLQLDELALKEVAFFAPEEAAAAEVRLGGVRALERSAGDKEPAFIVALQSAVLTGPRMSGPRRVELGQASLAGAECWLERGPDGAFEWSEWTAAEGEKAAQPEGKPEPLALRVGVATLGDGRLTFRDRSVSPPFRETVLVEEARIEGLDTADPKKEALALLRAKIGDYATLQVKGSLVPKAARPTMNLEGRLKGLDLPPLNSYAARFLDYGVNSGHLDTDLTWRVQEGILDSEARVTLAKLTVEPLKKEDGSRLAEMLGMPVKSALSMLRDKDDAIRLRLPIKGDIRDPSFNLNSLIFMATRAAVQKAALSYYAPLGVTLLTGAVLPPGTLFVAGKVVDWATTLRVNPVHFAPLESAPDAEGLSHLDKVAELLKGKPKARLVLCGRAVPTDLQTLRRSSGREQGWAPAEGEEESLLELARSRALAVKDHLVARGIDAGRLLVCSPDIEADENAAPRVDISI